MKTDTCAIKIPPTAVNIIDWHWKWNVRHSSTQYVYIAITKPTVADSSSPYKLLMAVLSPQNYLCQVTKIYAARAMQNAFFLATHYIFLFTGFNEPRLNEVQCIPASFSIYFVMEYIDLIIVATEHRQNHECNKISITLKWYVKNPWDCFNILLGFYQ